MQELAAFLARNYFARLGFEADVWLPRPNMPGGIPAPISERAFSGLERRNHVIHEIQRNFRSLVHGRGDGIGTGFGQRWRQ
jgi:hypothetical protein